MRLTTFFNSLKAGTSRGPLNAMLWSLTVCVVLLATSLQARAFTELNEAQTWVYDTPHLANTTAGQTIHYRYQQRLAEQEPVSDSVRLAINAAGTEGRRDVSVDFLTDERHLPLPDFQDFSGNPVIIATLEHIAQNLSAQSGGGTLYFRNRIRDGLAGAVDIETGSETLDGDTIAVTTLSFAPFTDDPRVGQQPAYRDALFSLTFSEAVPGKLVAVSVESAADEQFYFSYGIRIE